MQIETPMRYHYTPISMAKIQNTGNVKCWRGCGAREALISSLVVMQKGTATLEVSYETKHNLTI